MGGKKFSILGDSISTFAGITPKGGVFYDIDMQDATGVKTPEDTWWMQVINKAGGELLVNNSIMSSMVSGNFSIAGISDVRVKDLGRKGDPEVILVAMGTNDWAFQVLPEEFEEAYHTLLFKLKALYPYAEVWCATIIRGYLDDPDDIDFFNAESGISPVVYSDIIRKVAEEEEVSVADLASYDQEYPAIDTVHPTKEGMKILADLWCKELKL
ncbi:MAG: SGNH/GDSL hydrolase family protein [Lachnospiraceae bacterium]|nr:SGNH/GDSL hydrolase family protein [Lachnospiraceae bacterium]